MSTATISQLQHDFPKVYAAAKRRPVKITKRGKIIGMFSATSKAEKWSPPDFAAEARAHFGERLTAISLIEELEKHGGR
jgi:hypothetical protein